mmetsp:Transcript_80045/g.152190  ORF Transcript_80045/g.152190 Transcript_80045/m.152190 type:complete len:353 (-) Transcript_80045:68-1126(-)
MAEEEEEGEDRCDFFARAAHSVDPDLPSWPYDQKDAREDLADDSVWQEWCATALPPKVYDPPQFKYGCCTACFMPSLYFHRPGPPCDCDLCSCCCIPLCNSCCLYPWGSRKTVQFSDPDEWFTQMLQSPSNGVCPDFLKGIWWMQDNPGSETCATFHQGDWKNPRLCFQDTRRNYLHDATNVGGWSGAAYQQTKYMTRLEVSPDGKWVNIGGQSWMYIIQPGDSFVYADGTPFVTGPGDIMRLSYLDQPMDPKFKDGKGHTLMFQYMVRRIAYLDASGALVKTAAYDELLERVQQGPQKTCCGRDCCGFYELEEVPEADKQSVSILGVDYVDEEAEETSRPLLNAPGQMTIQ